MGFLIIALCAVVFLLSLRIEKNLYNPITIFSFIWMFIFSLYQMRCFGIFEVSDQTYYLMMLGIVSFFGGALAGYIPAPVKVKLSDEAVTDQIIHYRLIKAAGLIVLAFMACEAIETYQLLRSGNSLFEIRTSLQGYAEYDFSSGLYALRRRIGPLYTWMILPVYNSLLLITCIDIFIGKRDRQLIFISLLCMLLKSFKEGSRVAVFIFMIYLVFSFLICKESNIRMRNLKRIKKKLVIGTAALTGILILLSVIRISQGQKTVFEEIYMYFTCCIPLFDYWSNAPGLSFRTGGAASLYGIIQLPVTFLNVITGSSQWYKSGQQAITDTELFVKIRSMGYSDSYNAYTTAFYYFLKDFGITGIVAGSAVFGGVCSLVYNRIKCNIRNLAFSKRLIFIYLLLIQAMILSFVRIYFSVASFSFTFIYAFIFVRDAKAVPVRSVKNGKAAYR